MVLTTGVVGTPLVASGFALAAAKISLVVISTSIWSKLQYTKFEEFFKKKFKTS